MAAYLGLRALKYPYEYRTPYGDVLTLDAPSDLVTAWLMFYRGEYHVDPACRTVVDAGANIGAFSLLAARAAPGSRVVALEPFPQTRARLEQAVARNGLSDRVAVRPWALGPADGVGYMDLKPDPSIPIQSYSVHEAGERPSEALPVEVVSLPTLMEREGLERVDLLKLDIEGGEHPVFEAATPEWLDRIETLALEYHPNAPKADLFAAIQRSSLELAEDRVIDIIGPAGSGVAHFTRRRHPGERRPEPAPEIR